MPGYLIVANRTLASPMLTAAVEERIARGDARFHVVVPATPVTHGLTWDEEETTEAAERRLEAILVRLREQGATASGEVGSKDPVAAADDALRGGRFDEVLLSTLPPGLSKWLGQDVPSRIRRATDVPVTVLTPEAAPTGETAAGR
jgi:hypothetical protein